MRDVSLRRKSLLTLATTGLLLAVAACAPQGEAVQGEAITTASFTPLTDADPDTLALHLERLKARHEASEPESPMQAQQLLKAYGDATLTTARALVQKAGTSTPMKSAAIKAIFETLQRLQGNQLIDLDSMLAQCEELERMVPDTDVATEAALQRGQMLADAMLKATDKAEGEKRFKQLVAAALHIAKAKPPHPVAPTLINRIVMEALGRGEKADAETLLIALAENFPTDAIGKFARGSAERINAVGKPLTDFAGKDLFEDRARGLDELRGKVVLIDFWATWCQPCVEEMPRLQSLRRELKDKGFEILGVCLGQSKEAAVLFVSDNGFDWPHILNPNEAGDFAESPLALRFGVAAIPFKMLVDREGRLVASGFTLDELRGALDKAIESPATEPAKTEPAKTEPAQATEKPAPPPPG